jgi:hypothetical protein
VSPFGRRESAQLCSPIMADGSGARAGTREEGVSDGGSRQGGRVGGGEGGGHKLERGRRAV